MTRGLPASLVVHTVALLMVFLFGSHVQRQPVEPARAIRVRMVQLPQARPAAETPPAERPVEAPPAAETPPLPPKELPQEPERKRPEPEQKPASRERRPEAKPAPPRAADQATTAPEASLLAEGPAVAGTDSDFPFAWYLSRIEGLIVQNWQPRQLGFSRTALISCRVHFSIARGGAVSQVTLVQASGVGVYDREALRAVQTTRLPPLPPQYGASSLGVTFIFNLEPGNR